MGGGGSKQKSEADVVTNIMTNVTMNSTQNCTSVSIIKQDVEIRNNSYTIVKGNTIGQEVKLKMTCNMSAQQINDLNNQIADKISQSASSTQQAVLSALNSLAGSKQNQDLKTLVKNQLDTDITTNTIQNIVSSVNNAQNFIIEGNSHTIVDGNKATQSVDIITTAMNEAFSNTKLVNQIKANEAQQSTAIQKDPITDALKAVGSIFTGLLDEPIKLIIIGISIIFIVLIGIKELTVGHHHRQVKKYKIKKLEEASQERIQAPAPQQQVDQQPIIQTPVAPVQVGQSQ